MVRDLQPQLFNKEDVIQERGRGIWCAAETSATRSAAKRTKSRLLKASMRLYSGPCVEQQQRSTEFRGKAGGVAVITTYTARPYQWPSPDYLYSSTRFFDVVVTTPGFGPMLIIVIYGVAHPPFDLTHQLLARAAERGRKFTGPAVICGDLKLAAVTLPNLE